MSTLLDEETEVVSVTTPSQRLRRTTAAVRVSLKWLGVRKTVTPEQRSQAAEPFGAARDYLSVGKKLLDTHLPPYKAVTAVKGRILAYWKGSTLPYPEPGVRLIRQDQVAAFQEKMEDFRLELAQAVTDLENRYEEMRAIARQRLGSLFNPDDYPPSLENLFGVEWDFPSVEPPDYLLRLHPELYEQEKARVASRFEEAVQLAEQAFLTEFARLVTHLSERLAGGEQGQPKVFRDSALTNLRDFFERFREMGLRSHEELDRLVHQVQGLVRGVQPQQLRDNGSLREQIAGKLAGVQANVEGLLVDRPRRRILRASSQGGTDAPDR